MVSEGIARGPRGLCWRPCRGAGWRPLLCLPSPQRGPGSSPLSLTVKHTITLSSLPLPAALRPRSCARCSLPARHGVGACCSPRVWPSSLGGDPRLNHPKSKGRGLSPVPGFSVPADSSSVPRLGRDKGHGCGPLPKPTPAYVHERAGEHCPVAWPPACEQEPALSSFRGDVRDLEIDPVEGNLRKEPGW